MYYNVPQFTEIEDRIIGPLTLRQFLIFFGGAAIVFTLYSIFQLSFLFWITATPIAILTLAFSLGSFNGRPAINYLLPAFIFLITQKRRIFSRELGDGPVKIITQPEKEPDRDRSGDLDQLHRAAYGLHEREQIQSELTKQLNSNSKPEINQNIENNKA